MSRSAKTATQEPETQAAPAETQADPLIRTAAEVAAMTDEEKAAFRAAGGTTIE